MFIYVCVCIYIYRVHYTIGSYMTSFARAIAQYPEDWGGSAKYFVHKVLEIVQLKKTYTNLLL